MSLQNIKTILAIEAAILSPELGAGLNTHIVQGLADLGYEPVIVEQGEDGGGQTADSHHIYKVGHLGHSGRWLLTGSRYSSLQDRANAFLFLIPR